MRRHLGAMIAALVVLAAPGPAPAQQTEAAKLETATFAGGCFWCVEADFDKVDGVVSTTSGYMGGHTKNPTYQAVTAGGTGHLEVVQVKFDPARVSYEKLLEVFWHSIDPYDPAGQFCDKGDSYRTAIFTHTPEQKAAATASKERLMKDNPLKQPIVTEVREAAEFTAAEDYHQDYYKTNPLRYMYYRFACGRDARLEQIWGKKATN
jgi:peptide-methionine (S)-S-oxide reductase